MILCCKDFAPEKTAWSMEEFVMIIQAYQRITEIKWIYNDIKMNMNVTCVKWDGDLISILFILFLIAFFDFIAQRIQESKIPDLVWGIPEA